MLNCNMDNGSDTLKYCLKGLNCLHGVTKEISNVDWESLTDYIKTKKISEDLANIEINSLENVN
jgi:hypothetical protein